VENPDEREVIIMVMMKTTLEAFSMQRGAVEKKKEMTTEIME
jgi:hypothetical protein